MIPDHVPVNHISTSLNAQLFVNVSYIGCMQPGAQARSYQEAAHTREQDSSIINAVIQEVIHCGSCTYTRSCELLDSTISIAFDIEECARQHFVPRSLLFLAGSCVSVTCHYCDAGRHNFGDGQPNESLQHDTRQLI